TRMFYNGPLGDSRPGGHLALDPVLERFAAFKGDNQRVTWLWPWLPCSVVQALRIDDDLAVFRHGDAGLCGRVIFVLAQNHVRVGIVGKLQPDTYNPTFAIRVEAVVIVEMQIMERLSLRVGIEFDDAHASEVGPYILRPQRQRGTQ